MAKIYISTSFVSFASNLYHLWYNFLLLSSDVVIALGFFFFLSLYVDFAPKSQLSFTHFFFLLHDIVFLECKPCLLFLISFALLEISLEPSIYYASLLRYALVVYLIATAYSVRLRRLKLRPQSLCNMSFLSVRSLCVFMF